MRNPRFSLIALSFLFFLSSCSLGKDFQQRHYRTYFTKPVHESALVQAVIPPQENANAKENVSRKETPVGEKLISPKENPVPAGAEVERNVPLQLSLRVKHFEKAAALFPPVSTLAHKKMHSPVSANSGTEITTGKLLWLLLAALVALAMLGLAVLFILAGGWMILVGVLTAIAADVLAAIAAGNNDDYGTNKFRSFLSSVISVITSIVLILVFPVSIILLLIYLAYGGGE